MEYIAESKKIDGKTVTLMLMFDGEFNNLTTLKTDKDFMKRYAKDYPDLVDYDAQAYTWAEYAKDFKDFEKYQNHQGFSKDKEERITERDLKFYKKVKDFQKIPFRTFKKMCLSILSKVIFYEIEHNKEHLENNYSKPGYLTSDSLTIQIKLAHVPEREFYFCYNFMASDTETMCFYCSGLWFIQTVVAPFFFFEKIDFAYIERYIMHEFRHHLDYVNKWMVWDAKFMPIVKRFAKRKSMYGVLFLYKSLFNLREEGFADFCARQNSDKFEMDSAGIRVYNARLLQLADVKRFAKAEDFYENTISTGDLSASGEYTMGRNMCLIIAMHLCKKNKAPFTLVFPNGLEHNSYEFKGNAKKIIDKKEFTLDITLDHYMSNNAKIYIKNLRPEIIEEAKSIIGPLKHFHFLKMYEAACDDLGISENNRIMTVKRFHKILQDAIKKYEELKKKRLEDQGFLYLENDTLDEAEIEFLKGVPPNN